MLLTKENVVVYTVQIDTEKVNALICDSAIMDLFAEEFENAGLLKEAKKMQNGGYSYKMTTSNQYYCEYEVSITTRTTYL